MAKIDEVIDSLSEEELDILNSDPQMLSDFKAKYAPQQAPNQTSQQTIPGKIVSTLGNSLRPFGDITYPLTNPISSRLQSAGENVNQSVQGAASNIAEGGNPLAATAVSMLGDAGELTPQNIAIGVGSEAAPLLLAPAFSEATARAGAMRRSIGNKFVGTPLPSLKQSFRQGTETLGEKFLKTNLPANREEAFIEADQVIGKLENKIQKAIDSTVKEGKFSGEKNFDDSFSQAQQKLAKPNVLPPGESGGARKIDDLMTTEPFRPQREDVPGVGGNSAQRRTAFREKNPNVGSAAFNPENPAIEAKQIEYLKKEREDDILKARESFKKRMEDPEYGFKIKDGFAISRDEISSAINSAIDTSKKTGLEQDSVDALEKMKGDFEKTHPKFADVQYWNDVKRAIYKRVGDRGYLAKNSTEKVGALKDVASAIRGEIERVIPGIKDLNEKQGVYLQIRNALGDKLASQSKSEISSSLKQDLKDEALVRSARKKTGAGNFPYTRGVSGLALPVFGGEQK